MEHLQSDGAAPMSHVTSIIQRQVRHLVRLVDDLLDVGRIGHHKLRCELTPLALSDPIMAAVEMHRSLIAQRQLRVEVDAGGWWVKGDALRLVQIFGNLLHNAVKFSPVGGRIRVTARRTGSDRLAVSVRDDGAGMDAAQLAKVFDPYQQAHPDSPRACRGLGLGLTIVRALVEQHSGTICARSDGPGQGSEFLFTLLACEARAEPSLRAAPKVSLS